METRQNSLRERCDSPGAVTRRRRLLFGAKATCELGIAPLASAARLVAACGFLAALTAFPVRARAATFTVNSTADVVDTFPGDGFCDDGSGYCTLRAAIMESNFTSAGDTIDFDATISGSPITLVIPPDGTPDDAADGDLDITEDLTINGAGAATTIIDGAALDRVFHVLSGTVTISGVTIQGGTAVQGGGIYNVGDLTLTDTSVRTNTSGLQGGGIYSGGALTLYSSDVIGNTSQQGGGIFISACGPNFCGVAILNSSNVISNFASSSGGGIFNALAADTTLNSSTIHANSTSGSGGGIFNALAATATLNSSEVSGSSADTGGGIYDNGGTLILNSSTVILNTATASYGGGIYNQGSMTLTDTTVQDNSTLGSDLVGGGGGIYNQGPMTLTNTTVSGNATLGRGGGIYNLDQTLTLTNSTISENDGRNGGGIFNRYGTVSLTHVTDSHNIATDYAGGIWNYDGTMELTNTIVSDNTAFTASDNCRGVIASLGHNMDSDNTCGLNLLSDLPGVFPHLVPLALNAPGSTKTHALCTGLNTPVWQCMAASPAIDAVPTTDCTVATDQRGITRPQGPACDIGAFEGERCTSAPAGMVAWWTLDELTGGTATDIVGGHNGTHVNGPAPLAGQYVDNSLCFSGNSYVDVPSPGLNVGEDDFSIDAWVTRDPASTNSPPSVIVDKRDSVSAIGYALSVSYGRLVLTMSGTNFVTTTSPVPADGLWHLVAVTVHRDTNGGLFYIDGNPLPGDTFTPLLGNLDNANVFRIGAGLLGTNQPWVGCVDELELFNRALSPDEVAAIFEARQAGKCKCVVDPPAVDIQTVSVGNPGNAEDTEGDGYGGVDYVYNIGKHEVTAGQYTEFLNAVADEDTYGLYNEEMWSHEYGCKIERTGSSPNYCYSVGAEWADRPVNFVSWGDAARFANWLRNGQPTGPQGPNTTEDGSYFLNGATSDAGLIAVVRELDATWVIPSEDEWYKGGVSL